MNRLFNSLSLSIDLLMFTFIHGLCCALKMQLRLDSFGEMKLRKKGQVLGSKSINLQLKIWLLFDECYSIDC